MPVSSKLYQGLGSLPDTFKNFAFNTFLLFYYNQVLGLPASLASVAITAALVVDAITDPLVGAWSDRLQHRLGRRHPLMYASALPLGLCLYLVFVPPAGLDATGLLLWLAVFAVASRVSMTLFLVPWNALFAEFSDDYAERSSIVTWRYVCGWIAGVTFTFCTWTFIFPSSELWDPGHLNPDAYHRFAMVLGLLVTFAVLFTTRMTQREIPYLRQPIHAEALTAAGFFHDLRDALSNRQYMMIMLATLTSWTLTGTLGALELYINTYFWELAPEELRWFTLSIIGAVAAFISVPLLQLRFDKKAVVLAALAFLVINGALVISLRLADLLPPNSDPLLLKLLVSNEIIRIWAATVLAIMVVSMIADTLDDQELRTHRRQEGVFSAALAFAAKAMSGIGILAGGLIIDLVIGFPRGARPGEVDAGIIRQLGVVCGLTLPVLFVVPFWFVSRYDLTRERHAEIRAALTARRATET